MAAESPFHQVKLLNVRECSQCRMVIHDLHKHWIPRAGVLPFFSLGAAAYLDVFAGVAVDYRNRRKEFNPLLAEKFEGLYDRTREALERHTGMPIEDHPAGALPGFHIYMAHPQFTKQGGSIHFDLQYENVDWRGLGKPDWSSVLSFTLSICLPKAGGGLNWWSIEPDPWHAMSGEERDAYLEANPPNFLPYTAGEIVIHSGHLLHQIAPAKTLQRGDERITLQGHAVKVGKRFIWYW